MRIDSVPDLLMRFVHEPSLARTHSTLDLQMRFVRKPSPVRARSVVAVSGEGSLVVVVLHAVEASAAPTSVAAAVVTWAAVADATGKI